MPGGATYNSENRKWRHPVLLTVPRIVSDAAPGQVTILGTVSWPGGCPLKLVGSVSWTGIVPLTTLGMVS